MPSNLIPKRKLGNTGLEVTVLGMGGAPLGGLFQVRGYRRPFLLVCLSAVSIRLVLDCLDCVH